MLKHTVKIYIMVNKMIYLMVKIILKCAIITVFEVQECLKIIFHCMHMYDLWQSTLAIDLYHSVAILLLNITY